MLSPSPHYQTQHHGLPHKQRTSALSTSQISGLHRPARSLGLPTLRLRDCSRLRKGWPSRGWTLPGVGLVSDLCTLSSTHLLPSVGLPTLPAPLRFHSATSAASQPITPTTTRGARNHLAHKQPAPSSHQSWRHPRNPKPPRTQKTQHPHPISPATNSRGSKPPRILPCHACVRQLIRRWSWHIRLGAAPKAPWRFGG